MDDPRSEGWLVFAGILLMMAGAMRFFDAIWAWSYNGATPSHLKNALFGQTLSNYGWVYIVVAIVLFGAGFGVMMRSQVSRWLGIAAGAIGAISAAWWLPFYPVWSLTYILMCVLVIYALAAHGQREPA
jgi:hypothetical protein